MENEVLFSIVVPVYKTEKYLEKCLNSLLKQSVKDFEIILVDDGSPDNAPAMCDEFAKEDERIIVIHKQNAGVVKARVDGYRIARGKYILNVDSDDYVADDYLDKILFYLENYNCDMVCFNWDCVNDFEVTSTKKHIKKFEYFDNKKDICKKLLFDNNLNPLWLKGYKRKCMDGMDFDEDVVINDGEDLYRDLQILRNVDSAVFVKDSLYHYYSNPTSITRDKSVTKKSLESIPREKAIEFIKEFNIFDSYELEKYRSYCLELLFIKLRKFSRFGYTKKQFSEIFSEFRDSKYYKDFLSVGLPIDKKQQLAIKLFRKEKDNLVVDYFRMLDFLGNVKRIVKKG